MRVNKRPTVIGLGGTLRPQSRSLWALIHALDAAHTAGADVDLLALHNLRLPMYLPDAPLSAYENNVAQVIESVRDADALLWSTGAYHGTLAGVTKNALDFLELLGAPYLDGKVVGIITTAGGDIAAVNAANALVHTAHALRATVAPLIVTIPNAADAFDERGRVIYSKRARRLDQLGEMVVKLALERQPHKNTGADTASLSVVYPKFEKDNSTPDA
ncbi:MAG: NAD(P)H-dependent oxidoreductase [Anaerolineae bacterium]|nr:NAD(P)H-dependent oxidoreductase [Anaerolineae bacterium]